jgi:hypothetical protein
MASNVSLAVKSITAIDDSTEFGADEPYVLVTGVDFRNTVLPEVEVTLYGPWSDVDKGETHGTLVMPPSTPQAVIDVLSNFNVMRKPFWSLDNKTPAPIDPSKVIFIVSVMENDDGRPLVLRMIVKSAAVASLGGSTGSLIPDRVTKLIRDINGVLGTPTGFPNLDDVVGTSDKTSQQLILRA